MNKTYHANIEAINEYLEEVTATNFYGTALDLSGDGYYQPISSYDEFKTRIRNKRKNNEYK